MWLFVWSLQTLFAATPAPPPLRLATSGVATPAYEAVYFGGATPPAPPPLSSTIATPAYEASKSQ